MKTILFLSLTLLAAISVQAQDKYFTRDGYIRFFSSTSMEDIEAENHKVTAVLDEQLSDHRYQYPKKAYETVNMPERPKLIPEVPDAPTEVTVLRTELPGIVTLHKKATLENAAGDWHAFMAANDCFARTVWQMLPRLHS